MFDNPLILFPLPVTVVARVIRPARLVSSARARSGVAYPCTANQMCQGHKRAETVMGRGDSPPARSQRKRALLLFTLRGFGGEHHPHKGFCF